MNPVIIEVTTAPPMELATDPTMELVEFKWGSGGSGSVSSSSSAPKPKRSCLKNKSTDPNHKYLGSDSPGYFCLLLPTLFLSCLSLLFLLFTPHSLCTSSLCYAAMNSKADD